MRRRPVSGLVASIFGAAAFATVTAGLMFGARSARAVSHAADAKQPALAELAVVTAGAAVAATTDRTAAPSLSRRQRELEDLRRQDVARDLEARGVTVL